MSLVRAIVKWSLYHTFNINTVHVTSDNSGIADSISRKQRQGFKLLSPIADQLPIAVYTGFLNFCLRSGSFIQCITVSGYVKFK